MTDTPISSGVFQACQFASEISGALDMFEFVGTISVVLQQQEVLQT